MNILITGAFGYLGGRISRHLAAQEDLNLVLASRRERAAPSWLQRGRVALLDLETDDGLPADLCDGIDTIIHLAAPNENVCGEDPVRACAANVLGSVRLLEQALAAGVPRFINFSTARVYREPLIGTIDESTPCQPVHSYGITHRNVEDHVRAAHLKGRCTGLSIRLANGFGAPEQADVDRWTLLTNDLCRQAASRGRMVLRSSGLQLRNFITLEDVARAVEHFCRLPEDACGDGIFNLAGTESQSILSMAQLTAERARAVFGEEIVLEHPEPAPGETADPLDYRVDKLLGTGFTFTGDFAGEIDRTLRLCREAFGNEG